MNETAEKLIKHYRKKLENNIFALIETMKIGYTDLITMPVKKFYNLIAWKNKLEKEREKYLKEEMSRRRSKK